MTQADFWSATDKCAGRKRFRCFSQQKSVVCNFECLKTLPNASFSTPATKKASRDLHQSSVSRQTGGSEGASRRLVLFIHHTPPPDHQSPDNRRSVDTPTPDLPPVRQARSLLRLCLHFLFNSSLSLSSFSPLSPHLRSAEDVHNKS